MATARSYSHFFSLSAPLTAPEIAICLQILRERRSVYDLPQVDPELATHDVEVASASPDLDVVALYFEDAIRNGHSTLLGHAEEIELARAIDEGKRAAAHLATKRPCDGKLAELERLVSQGEQARERLITANLRLVVTVAGWYRNSAVPLADLIQEGNIGLMQAAEKYDWRRGTRFSTYAVWWIRQAISRSLANDSRLIRVPVHAHQKLAMIARTRRDLCQDTGTDPSSADIAQRAGLPESQVRHLMPYLASPASLEAPIENQAGEATNLAATTPQPDALSTEDQVAQAIAHEALQKALSTLTPREEQLLARRYGLRQSKGLSLRAAGEALGLTKGQAQTIETRALAKLRRLPIGNDSTWLP